MSVEALLNLANESTLLNDSSDQEIFKSVMDAIAACENIEFVGGDDVGDEGPIEPPPTCQQVLQASSIIHKYIDTVDDPVVWKLEDALASFNCPLCCDAVQSTRATKIPEWFRS